MCGKNGAFLDQNGRYPMHRRLELLDIEFTASYFLSHKVKSPGFEALGFSLVRLRRVFG